MNTNRVLKLIKTLEMFDGVGVGFELTAQDVTELLSYIHALEQGYREAADTVIYPPQDEHIFTDNGPIQVTYDD